jgi:hypothetical protein
MNYLLKIPIERCAREVQCIVAADRAGTFAYVIIGQWSVKRFAVWWENEIAIIQAWKDEMQKHNEIQFAEHSDRARCQTGSRTAFRRNAFSRRRSSSPFFDIPLSANPNSPNRLIR